MTVVAIVFLLAANAFFVAAEFALIKARGFRIETLAQQGSRAARLIQRIHADLEAYLAACQLGITMASLGLGWVGEPAVAALLEPLLKPLALGEHALHTIAFIVGFLVFSSLHIVVGEQVPKTFAIRKAEPVSLATAYPLHWFYILCYPLNWALNRVSGGILALFKVEEATHADVLSDAELRGLIDVSSEHGEMHLEKAQMLHNMFEFDQRTVMSIMVPRTEIEHLDLAKPSEYNVQVMRESPHSRLPLIDRSFDSALGVVLVKDLYVAMLGGEAEPWRELERFCREPLFVPESLGLAALFDSMRSARNHMALVMDEYGTLVGLITMEDLLEEIVGEISDETDERVAEYGVEVTEYGWDVDGLAPLTDVSRAIGIDFGDSLDVNTLSGLFMRDLGRIPSVGDEILVDGYRLTVTELQKRHVKRVRIEKLGAGTTEQPPATGADSES